MGLPLLPIIFQNPDRDANGGYVLSMGDRTISISAPKVSPSAIPSPKPTIDKFDKFNPDKRVTAVKKRANRYVCRADTPSTGIRFPYFLNFSDGTLRACEAFSGTTFPPSRILRVDATPGGVVNLEAVPDQLDNMTRHNNSGIVRILIRYRDLVEYLQTKNPKTAAGIIERIAPGNAFEYLSVDSKGISARISGEARTLVAPLLAEPVVTIDVNSTGECPVAELNVGNTKILTIREFPSPRPWSIDTSQTPPLEVETIEVLTRIEITTADAARPESSASPHNQRFTITPPAGMTPQDFADAILSEARIEATGSSRLLVSVFRPQGMNFGPDDAGFNASICTERNTHIRNILFTAANASNDGRSIERQLQKITEGSGVNFGTVPDVPRGQSYDKSMGQRSR